LHLAQNWTFSKKTPKIPEKKRVLIFENVLSGGELWEGVYVARSCGELFWEAHEHSSTEIQ
jgi:hypothetical protein